MRYVLLTISQKIHSTKVSYCQNSYNMLLPDAAPAISTNRDTRYNS